MTDYQRIHASCRQSGELWEDPDFAATQTSVFYHQTPPFQFEWKRPKELVATPTFVQKYCDFFDMSPGRMGDFWLTSCLGMLFSSKALLYRIIPAEQDFDKNYSGVFRFRVYWCGAWTEVLVDDRLPTLNCAQTFVHCKTSSQFWPALLEKAYAKLLGSYEALKYGTVMDGLADLTGGLTESWQLLGDADTQISIIQQLLWTASIVTCTALPEASQYGFQGGMNYKILALVKVDVAFAGVPYVIKLGRPLDVGETHPELIDATLWSQMQRQCRGQLSCERDTLWLFYAEFRKLVSHLEVVHLDAAASQREASLCHKQRWHSTIHQARWRKGVTAGGCRNNIDFVHMNPQVQLSLDGTNTVIISLNQHSVMEPRVIGFSLYILPAPLTETVDASFFKLHKPMVNSQYTNSRQFSQRCLLKAGFYLVVPTTFEPRHEACFNVRVFSLQPITMKVLDMSPSMTGPAVVKAPEACTFSEYEQVFLQLCDEQRTVDVFELQELLETCLPNDYIKSCTSLDTCRQIVLAMDTCGKGRISLSDFKDLICSLKHWQAVFKVHTLEKMGVLRAERLREALRDLGLALPERALALVVLRYMRKDGTLRFGDFVSAVLHLQVIFKLFESKDTDKSGTIKLNLDETGKEKMKQIKQQESPNSVRESTPPHDRESTPPHDARSTYFNSVRESTPPHDRESTPPHYARSTYFNNLSLMSLHSMLRI